jgi:hypothetical protein
MESKTIKEYLETLPEPYRSQALKNTYKIHLDEAGKDSVGHALKSAFFWESSPEGHDYWENFYHSLK